MNKNKLPDGWREVKLEEILASPIQNGYSPVCQEIETGRWVLSLGALTGNSFDKTQKKAVPLDKKINNDFLLKYGDILISRSNTIDKVGRTAVFRDEIHNCFYPDLIMRFRINEKLVATYFLEKVLQSNIGRKYFEKSAAGTSGSMVKINKTTIENFTFIFPPLPEQNAIADTLSAWDTMIEKIEQLITKKEKTFELLRKKVLNDSSHTIKKFSDLLQEEISIEKGHLVTKNTLTPGNIPVIGGGQSVCSFINMATHMQETITISASGAYAGFVWYHDYPIWASDCSVITRKKMNLKFLFYALQEQQKNIYNRQAGGAQPHIYVKDLLTIKIEYPSIINQEKIVNLLDLAQREIDLPKQLLEHYKKQKRGLMQKLLTGAWRIPPK